MPSNDLDSIKSGQDHVLLKNPLVLVCTRCKKEFSISNIFPNGAELWVIRGLSWGFCAHHADCEEEFSDIKDRDPVRGSDLRKR